MPNHIFRSAAILGASLAFAGGEQAQARPGPEATITPISVAAAKVVAHEVAEQAFQADWRTAAYCDPISAAKSSAAVLGTTFAHEIRTPEQRKAERADVITRMSGYFDSQVAIATYLEAQPNPQIAHILQARDTKGYAAYTPAGFVVKLASCEANIAMGAPDNEANRSMSLERVISNLTARAYRLGYDSTLHFTDRPDHVYPEHAHEETRLFTITGSVELVLAGERHVLRPQSEFVVPEGALHAATVGGFGWTALAAWRASERLAWRAAHPLDYQG